jgi:hypothetical protein
VPPLAAEVPKVPLAHGGEVLNATVEDQEISFDTDAVGVPHLVRTSFFPNWRVHGGTGPYQVSPSVMMVIPTQRHVILRYERTWAEWLGLVLTMGGLSVVLIVAARTLGRIVFARRRGIAQETVEARDA